MKGTPHPQRGGEKVQCDIERVFVVQGELAVHTRVRRLVEEERRNREEGCCGGGGEEVVTVLLVLSRGMAIGGGVVSAGLGRRHFCMPPV